MNNVNIKVVIVWGLAIVILFGIGIFGMNNQDLIHLEDPYVPIAIEKKAEDKKCSATFENGQTIFEFVGIDEENGGVVNKFSVTYKTISTDIEGYTIATKINDFITENNISGLTSLLSGGIDDYQIKVIVDRNLVNVEALASIAEDLNRLNIKIDNISSYDGYTSYITGADPRFTCE